MVMVPHVLDLLFIELPNLLPTIDGEQVERLEEKR